jgi:hypothetical protein
MQFSYILCHVFLSNEPLFRPTQRLRYRGACSAEAHFSKVEFDCGLSQTLIDSCLSEASEFLLPAETVLIAESGRNITQIMGLRFLTDYLEGDNYYQTVSG